MSPREAGLIMRTDWEVVRQAASDRTLRARGPGKNGLRGLGSHVMGQN